jgi:hypothetical protein
MESAIRTYPEKWANLGKTKFFTGKNWGIDYGGRPVGLQSTPG